MSTTPNLALPYIFAAQSQKHVTHNEAIRALDALLQLMVLDKDLAAPPGSPAEGGRYIIPASPTGVWAGQTGKIAAWQDSAWAFYLPKEGWLAWVADENLIYAHDGAAWIAVSTGGGGGGGLANIVEDTTPQLGGHLDVNGFAFGDGALELLKFSETASAVNEVTIANAATGAGPTISASGDNANVDLNLAGKGTGHAKAPVFGVNAVADATNRLAVSSAASLFNNAGAGHQVKLNKNAAGDTASFLFQTGFSGRAEIGTTGDDDFHFKVSPNGSAFNESILINKTTGVVTFPSGLQEATTAVKGATELAAASEYRSNAAGNLSLTPAEVWSAAGIVALTDAATVAVDMSAGLNFSVTLDGSRTLGNPTNTKVGQSGAIFATQDGTGGRALAFGSNWEFAGGTAVVLSTAANAKDALFYFVQSSTSILVTGVMKAVS